MPSGQGVCVESCPLTTNYTEIICFDEVEAEITDNVTGEVTNIELMASFTMRGVFLGS